MKRATMFWKFYVVWSLLIIGGCITWACRNRVMEKTSEHVYDTAFGSVVCGKWASAPCGITLIECHDGAEYRCMLNTRMRE